jgi:SAM-dependent methyltransferase
MHHKTSDRTSETGLPVGAAECFTRLDLGEWRSPIFAELLELEVRHREPPVTLLEVGCGLGFDGDHSLQKKVASLGSRVIGVEPDRDVVPQPVFTEVHRCLLEQAPIEAGSVDLAFSVMVMEHVPDPSAFLSAVHRVLRNGGVYWGFTVNRRHWFTLASTVASRLQLKTAYLRWLNGANEKEDYLDYPTFYRLNSAAAFQRDDPRFTKVYARSYGAVDAAAGYVAGPLKGIIKAFEAARVGLGGERIGFLIRLEK